MDKTFAKKGGRRGGPGREKSEFDKNILELARVTRVTEGGKHMSFRTLVVAGDRHGRVGYGLDKGKDVQLGVEKATRHAEKSLIKVPIVNDTIPHEVYFKYKAAKVLLRPAPHGAGIIAGGPVRVILELAGVPNASSKMLGHTKNKIAIVRATFGALEKLFTEKRGARFAKPAVNPKGATATKESEKVVSTK